ncbi:glycosyltransferase family 39 protein [Chitinophaga sp. S165]|uniref:ArnT family glycosyltransferase n=1 Tax=Chitinophaga sp. S165 TaxID=2135462 RepID=UPI000D70B2C4|nr:glycosyltransferase family 39 protein [Chitinophaga sp. S165]PWV55807.1 dolichyl-phosphate-mannose-protein mannosyltransferase [Chitinophaga sp. S165]
MIIQRPRGAIHRGLWMISYLTTNMRYPNEQERLLIAAGITGYLLLLIITIIHRQPPLFDEPLFISNVLLLDQYGLSREFLLNIDNQAPGPLYQFVHYVLRPITHLQPPGIRLVNAFMLLMIIVLLAAIVRKTQAQRRIKRNVWLPALHIMAVPMIWQVSGMALTEVPSMLFATLSIWLLQLAPDYTRRQWWFGICLSLLAGICLGLAILGRSPFLMIVPASLLLLLQTARERKRWVIISIYIGVALLCCIPVFVIWGGLTPPKQAVISEGGIVPWHGILAFAYGALIILIVAPAWFSYNRLILLVLVLLYIILLPVNYYWLHYTYAPLSEALGKIVPAAIMQIYPYLISPLLLTLALYFLYCAFLQWMERRTEPFSLFILLSLLLMLATSFKVTHLFSSRYVAQTAPLFIIMLAPYIRVSRAQLIRFAAGMIIGLLSLETYFLFR